MNPATFTTTCARCAAPLESTDATADAVSKAHEASCIIPGDEVRWDYMGYWIEGALESVWNSNGQPIANIDVTGSSFDNSIRRRSVGLGGSATFRRIPRPEQAVKATKPDLFDRMMDAHYPRDADVLPSCRHRHDRTVRHRRRDPVRAALVAAARHAHRRFARALRRDRRVATTSGDSAKVRRGQHADRLAGEVERATVGLHVGASWCGQTQVATLLGLWLCRMTVVNPARINAATATGVSIAS